MPVPQNLPSAGSPPDRLTWRRNRPGLLGPRGSNKTALTTVAMSVTSPRKNENPAVHPARLTRGRQAAGDISALCETPALQAGGQAHVPMQAGIFGTEATAGSDAPSAGPQIAMPKNQRIEYTRYAPVHLFPRIRGWPASPGRAQRVYARGVPSTHNVQCLPDFVADTLISEVRTMGRELKMSDLFYKALKLLGLQEYYRFLVLVSRTRHFRVWAEPRGINRSVRVRNREATAGCLLPPGGGGLGWGGY